MQKRMIHMKMWASEQIGKLSLSARLLYIGTIVLGDDEGRLRGNPAFLRSQIFLYDEDISINDVKIWLDEIINQRLLIPYLIEEETYLYHPNWIRYQQLRKDRLKDSFIPAPDWQPNGNQMATKCPPKIREDKIREDKINNLLTSFAEFWLAYPKKVSRKVAEKSWLHIKPNETLFKKIMSALEVVKKSDGWVKDDGKFIPHPSTWLNQERWDDVVTVKAIISDSEMVIDDPLFKKIIKWGNNNNDSKIAKILPIWWAKYGKTTIQKLFSLDSGQDGGYKTFLADMSALKGNTQRSGDGLNNISK
jgi:hypothetical protein